MPKTLLDHARRELAELCRQFDGALPYFRLKNTMQAFSDKLESRRASASRTGDRRLMASLIRWSTMEVEALGWSVTNNPVQGDSDAYVGRLGPGFVPGAEEDQTAIGVVPLARRQLRSHELVFAASNPRCARFSGSHRRYCRYGNCICVRAETDHCRCVHHRGDHTEHRTRAVHAGRPVRTAVGLRHRRGR